MAFHRQKRYGRSLGAAGFVLLAASFALPAQGLPSRLSDSAFWKLVTDISEPGGYFRSDNFVSNETSYQLVLAELTARVKPSSAYVGVGPDQNFTYIVALHPRLSFICDIRRQNMLEHLLYKAILERASDRADFLSYLFSRPRPAGLDTAATAGGMLEKFYVVAPDSTLYKQHLTAIKELLTKTHGFALSDDDLRGIEYVFSAFYTAGPDISYNFPGGRGFMRGMPTYAELMIATNGRGENLAYIGSETNYRVLRQAERDNLIVPVVGDFGGDKALRAIGAYLAQHGATVGAFYTSNVEQYLFQSPDLWRRFYANVGAMPLDSGSTFIRAVFNGMGFRAPGGVRAAMMLAPIMDQIAAFNDGRIASYYDVIQSSKEPQP